MKKQFAYKCINIKKFAYKCIKIKKGTSVIFFHKFIVINGLCSRIDTRWKNYHVFSLRFCWV